MSDSDSPTQVLLVEDDAALAAIAQQSLEALGYGVIGPYDSAEDLLTALPKLQPMPDVVLMDINLRGTMDGIEAAEAIHRDYGLPIVYASAFQDESTIKRATKAEPFGYIVKPYQLGDLRAALTMALYRNQRDHERQEILEKTVGGSIEMLTEILSVVEPQSFGRAQRLKEHMLTLAAALEVRTTWEFEAAALLAPIGRVMVPPTILQKHRLGTPLSGVEQEMIVRSAGFGSDLLKRIPRLESVAHIVLYQSKNFDGTGFPRDEVAGENLPLGARMLVVLIDFIQLVEAGLNPARIVEKMRATAGRYDPQILQQAILSVIDAPPKGAKPLKLEELRVGHTLKAAVESLDGTLLVAAETQMTAVLLQRLHNFMQVSGVKEPIYVQNSP